MDRSDYELDRGCDYLHRDRVTLLIHDQYDREIVIAEGSRRDINKIKVRLDLIVVQGGHKAYLKEIRKLRNEYLAKSEVAM